MMRLLLVAFVVLTGCAVKGNHASEPPSGSNPTAPTPSRSVEPVQPDPAPPRNAGPPSSPDEAYDRASWKHWTDDDGDCQDTRTEVLIAESEVPVTLDRSGCKVVTGRWRCPYTGRVFENPRDLDVDHRVPLRHAHEHGAAAWTGSRRRDYANDLEHAEHLVAVSASANRSKGAKGIDAWLPEDASQRCEYVGLWMEVKRTWGLEIDVREAELAVSYAALCAEGRELPLPQDATDLDEALTSPDACCRVCRTSKPCGDACISASKTCHSPPGCACAG